jgi:hypothetical protein
VYFQSTSFIEQDIEGLNLHKERIMRSKRLTGFGILAVGFAVAPVRAQLTNNLANNLQVYYSFNNPAANGGFAPDYVSPALTAQTGTSASGYVANQ